MVVWRKGRKWRWLIRCCETIDGGGGGGSASRDRGWADGQLVLGPAGDRHRVPRWLVLWSWRIGRIRWDGRERRALRKLSGRGGRERRKLGSWWRRVEVGVVVANARPSPRSGPPRGKHVRYRRLGIPPRVLLTDYIWVQPRSGVGILWMGGIRSSYRAGAIWLRRIRILLRPRLGHRRPMDHRAIHESNCSRDGGALEGETVLVGFIQTENSALELQSPMIDEATPHVTTPTSRSGRPPAGRSICHPAQTTPSYQRPAPVCTAPARSSLRQSLTFDKHKKVADMVADRPSLESSESPFITWLGCVDENHSTPLGAPPSSRG